VGHRDPVDAAVVAEVHVHHNLAFIETGLNTEHGLSYFDCARRLPAITRVYHEK
jgi:hypothetical protein